MCPFAHFYERNKLAFRQQYSEKEPRINKIFQDISEL